MFGVPLTRRVPLDPGTLHEVGPRAALPGDGVPSLQHHVVGRGAFGKGTEDHRVANHDAVLALDEFLHQVHRRAVRQPRGLLVARSHVRGPHVGRHVGDRIAALAAGVPCRQVKPLAVSGESGGRVTGERLDVLAGGHGTGGQCAEQRPVTGRRVRQ